MDQKTDSGGNAKRPKAMSEKSQVTVKTTLITVVGSVLVAGFTTLGTIFATKSSVAEAQAGASKAKTSVDELEKQVANAMTRRSSTEVPAGTIIPYGGPIASERAERALKDKGWLPCDGRAVSRTEYTNLWEAINVAWGEGDRGTTFNLPDLRGVFLRGVNRGREDKYADPEASKRSPAAPGAVSRDGVGSFQDDALQNVAGIIGEFNAFGASRPSSSGAFQAVKLEGTGQGIPGGYKDPYHRITMDLSRAAKTSSETRPKNACVNYIIKY